MHEKLKSALKILSITDDHAMLQPMLLKMADIVNNRLDKSHARPLLNRLLGRPLFSDRACTLLMLELAPRMEAPQEAQSHPTSNRGPVASILAVWKYEHRGDKSNAANRIS